MRSTYLLMILFLSMLTISTADELQCYDTGNFTKNGTYDQNRNILLSSLASEVAANGGLYRATIGQEPKEIYAVAFCVRVVTTESRLKCLNETVREISTQCPNHKEAYIWAPRCHVRYAKGSFLGKFEMEPVIKVTVGGDIQWDRTAFNQIWESLRDRIVKIASKDSSRLKFATDAVKLENLTPFRPKLYASVQCMLRWQFPGANAGTPILAPA